MCYKYKIRILKLSSLEFPHFLHDICMFAIFFREKRISGQSGLCPLQPLRDPEIRGGCTRSRYPVYWVVLRQFSELDARGGGGVRTDAARLPVRIQHEEEHTVCRRERGLFGTRGQEIALHERNRLLTPC